MAYSDLTMQASLIMGFQGNPSIVPTEAIPCTATIGGIGATLNTFYDPTIIFTSPSTVGVNAGNFTAATFEQVIFKPNVVVNGVTKWVIKKYAATTDTHFLMMDDDNNIHYDAVINFDYATYEQFTVNTDEPPLTYDTSIPIALCIYARPNDLQHYTLAWIMQPTALAETLYNFQYKVTYGDNIGSVPLSTWGTVSGDTPMSFDDYIDATFNGVYDNEGQLAKIGEKGGSTGSNFERPDYEINFPNLLDFSITDTSMISMYSLTPGELKAFANYMWNGNFFSTIQKLWSDPLANIISLQRIPLTAGQLNTVQSNIIIGNCDSLITSKKINKQFYLIDCGRINVKECYKNFADYHTTIAIYLPYCGIVQLNTDDVMNGRIWVKYQVDIFSGSCVAYINCNTNGVWHILSEHAGNCNVQFPITGANYATTYLGAVSAVGALANGSVGGAVSNVLSMKPEYMRSGGVTGTSGMMGVQYPYLIFTTPNYIIAESFRETKGYTSNLTVTIKNASGYLQAIADNSELSGIPCTDTEREMIRSLLADGIYLD